MRLSEDAKTDYLLEHFGKENQLHKKIREKSEQEKVLGMQISAYEGQMLQLFSRMIGAKKIVEVGCLYGYSALWLLEALPEDGQLYLLEVDHQRLEWIQRNFADHPQFHCLRFFPGDARESLDEVSTSGPFDMCFIDANKGAYCDYLDWAEKSVRKGGLIAGDNSFLFGSVYAKDPKDADRNQVRIMGEFNRRLSDPELYFSSLIPTEEGLTLGLKKF